MDDKTIAISCPLCGSTRYVARSVLTTITDIDRGKSKCLHCGCEMHVRWDELHDETVTMLFTDYIKLKIS